MSMSILLCSLFSVLLGMMKSTNNNTFGGCQFLVWNAGSKILNMCLSRPSKLCPVARRVPQSHLRSSRRKGLWSFEPFRLVRAMLCHGQCGDTP